MKTGLFGTFVLAALSVATMPAKADIVWTLHNVAFDDGGVLSTGQFTIDLDNYLLNGSASATTTDGTTSNGTGGPLPGTSYDDSLIAAEINYPTDDTVTMFWSTEPGYYRSLVLQFENPLTSASSNDPIVYGYECVGWTCPNGTGTRFVVDGGYASSLGAVPEIPTWAMMIMGAGVLAFGARTLRARPRLVHA